MPEYSSFDVFTPEIAKKYIIDNFGVSSDVAILNGRDLLFTLSAALSERHTGVDVDATPAHLEMVYQKHVAEGTLPPELHDQDLFTQRYLSLIGREAVASGEIVDAIAAKRNEVPTEIQRRFEQETAKTVALLWHKAIDENPSLHQKMLHATTFYLERTMTGNFMCSGNGLREKLPKDHAGIIQGAPTFNDIIKRWSEVGPGKWDNIALLSTNYFSEELSRQIGPQLFEKSDKRVFATSDGLAKGSETLRRKIAKNRKLKVGYGAMILSDVRHLDTGEITAAIDAAPFLLAKGGLLLISELDSFQDGEGSVFHLMNHARAVFGSDPRSIHLMTLDHGEGSGRQAAFVKT